MAGHHRRDIVIVMRHGVRRDAELNAEPEANPPLSQAGTAAVPEVGRDELAPLILRLAVGAGLIHNATDVNVDVTLRVSPFARTWQTAQLLRDALLSEMTRAISKSEAMPDPTVPTLHWRRHASSSQQQPIVPLIIENSLSEVYGPIRIKKVHSPDDEARLEEELDHVCRESGLRDNALRTRRPKWPEDYDAAVKRYQLAFDTLANRQRSVPATHGDALTVSVCVMVTHGDAVGAMSTHVGGGMVYEVRELGFIVCVADDGAALARADALSSHVETMEDEDNPAPRHIPPLDSVADSAVHAYAREVVAALLATEPPDTPTHRTDTPSSISAVEEVTGDGGAKDIGKTATVSDAAEDESSIVFDSPLHEHQHPPFSAGDEEAPPLNLAPVVSEPTPGEEAPVAVAETHHDSDSDSASSPSATERAGEQHSTAPVSAQPQHVSPPPRSSTQSSTGSEPYDPKTPKPDDHDTTQPPSLAMTTDDGKAAQANTEAAIESVEYASEEPGATKATEDSPAVSPSDATANLASKPAERKKLLDSAKRQTVFDRVATAGSQYERRASRPVSSRAASRTSSHVGGAPATASTGTSAVDRQPPAGYSATSGQQYATRGRSPLSLAQHPSPWRAPGPRSTSRDPVLPPPEPVRTRSVSPPRGEHVFDDLYLQAMEQKRKKEALAAKKRKEEEERVKRTLSPRPNAGVSLYKAVTPEERRKAETIIQKALRADPMSADAEALLPKYPRSLAPDLLQKKIEMLSTVPKRPPSPSRDERERQQFCTFAPRINRPSSRGASPGDKHVPSSRSSSAEASERLYREAETRRKNAAELRHHVLQRQASQLFAEHAAADHYYAERLRHQGPQAAAREKESLLKALEEEHEAELKRRTQSIAVRKGIVVGGGIQQHASTVLRPAPHTGSHGAAKPAWASPTKPNAKEFPSSSASSRPMTRSTTPFERQRP